MALITGIPNHLCINMSIQRNITMELCYKIKSQGDPLLLHLIFLFFPLGATTMISNGTKHYSVTMYQNKSKMYRVYRVSQEKRGAFGEL